MIACRILGCSVVEDSVFVIELSRTQPQKVSQHLHYRIFKLPIEQESGIGT